MKFKEIDKNYFNLLYINIKRFKGDLGHTGIS